MRRPLGTLSGLSALIAAWPVLAPWVLGYRYASRWNDVGFGLVLALLAVQAASDVRRTVRLSWINASVGCWIFFAAFTVDHNGSATWNDIVVGSLASILSLAAVGARVTASAPQPERGPAL